MKMKIKLEGGDRLSFWCPGCNEAHPLNSKTGTWNGDFVRPTFTPSVLYTAGHFAPHWKEGDNCWCTYWRENPDDPPAFTCMRCHSFVTDGRIQFLSDCTHSLVGQTVELPNFPEDNQGVT